METQDPLFHAEMAIFHAAMALGPFCKSERKLRKIARQVASLQHSGGPETIEGVRLDFRSPLLNPKNWQLNLLGSALMHIPDVGSGGPGRDFPSLWFPWFGKFDFDRYVKLGTTFQNSVEERRFRAPNGQQLAAEYSTGEMQEIVRINRPTQFVEKGDAVRIHRVNDKSLGDNAFEHTHDAIIKEVYLEIARLDGSTLILPEPYLIPGTQAIISNGDDIDHHVYTIMRRLSDSYNVKNTSDLAKIEQDGSTRARAASIGIEVMNMLYSLHASQVEEIDEELDRYLFEITGIINKAAMLGFLWAKAEAEIELKPLAKSAIQRKNSNISGGTASGKARRKIAEDGWKKIAKQLAFDIRGRQPSGIPSFYR